MQNLSNEGLKYTSWDFQKVLDHQDEIQIEQVMAFLSWENLGNFKKYVLGKFEFLRQWLKFLNLKHISKTIEDS